MDPLYYLKNVLVTFDSDQLTLPHCPPIHLCTVQTVFVKIRVGPFCKGGPKEKANKNKDRADVLVRFLEVFLHISMVYGHI